VKFKPQHREATPGGVLTTERLFTIRGLAEIWFRENWRHFYHLVRRWFIHPDGTVEPGVVFAGNGRKNKRLLVPESVAAKVYERRMKGRVA
jgi:hypothetical protein